MLNLSSLTVGYLNKPPFTQNDQKLDEVFYQVFLTIVHQLNLSVVMTKPLTGQWGQLDNQTQTWDGLIGDLVERRVDVSITSLAQTEERNRVVDFSIPVYRYTPVFTRWVSGLSIQIYTSLYKVGFWLKYTDIHQYLQGGFLA